MFKRADSKSVSRARQLRRDATDAERRLWAKLRELNRRGFHFRRQAPFRSYILDFVEHRAKLAIELDGSQHVEHTHHVRDSKRDRLLASQGYRTLRFWNNDLQNLDGVVHAILAELKKRPYRPPPARAAALATSPQRGR